MTRPELHSFPTPSRLVYKFEGLGGMDHFYLHGGLLWLLLEPMAHTCLITVAIATNES